MYCIFSIHIFFFCTIYLFIYLFISNEIKIMSLTPIFFGKVHSDRTVVVLQHKDFVCSLKTSRNSISIVIY